MHITRRPDILTIMSKKHDQPVHWADIHAQNIIRRRGEKDVYVCASGITPSGTVHIGNFREIISVELITRALKDAGKSVRFIYSWDDYDVFRKVPKNMPDRKLLESCLRKPITLVPDTAGTYENYARANEKPLEDLLPEVGVNPEYIYQAERYRRSFYARQIRTALEHRDQIREYLNEHRSEPLPEDWMPVSVFSSFTDKDTTEVLSWDGAWEITYRCLETGQQETLDLGTASGVKLPWRADWPMRWAYEEVDFEPAGKDHHSQGGSFDTSKRVVEVFGGTAPYSFQYDFIRIKGRGGKISSSSGDVVDLAGVLEIYQPEIVRYLFAGTKPNSEFAVSFDLDVLKIYEDYDTCERIYYGAQEVGEKRRAKESRIYELSQVDRPAQEMPYQIPIRHLCNLIQIHSGDIEQVMASLPALREDQKEKLRRRCICAANWVRLYAPEDFRFSLRSPAETAPEISGPVRTAAASLLPVIEQLDAYDEKQLSEAIYEAAHSAGCEPKELFLGCYQVLIGKDRGPRLANFIKTCGREKILPLFEPYR